VALDKFSLLLLVADSTVSVNKQFHCNPEHGWRREEERGGAFGVFFLFIRVT
jgi:hypothetical protein